MAECTSYRTIWFKSALSNHLRRRALSSGSLHRQSRNPSHAGVSHLRYCCSGCFSEGAGALAAALCLTMPLTVSKRGDTVRPDCCQKRFICVVMNGAFGLRIPEMRGALLPRQLCSRQEVFSIGLRPPRRPCNHSCRSSAADITTGETHVLFSAGVSDALSLSRDDSSSYRASLAGALLL